LTTGIRRAKKARRWERFPTAGLRIKKEKPAWQRPTLPGVNPLVPSALEGLTSVFGMETGGSPPLWSPDRHHTLTMRPEVCFGFEEKPSTDSDPSAKRITALTPRTDPPRHLQGVLLPQGDGKSHLGVGFALRCFQRLSRPHMATQRCPWRDNWYTSGASVPVLSY
jgi:hypothetical protein